MVYDENMNTSAVLELYSIKRNIYRFSIFKYLIIVIIPEGSIPTWVLTRGKVMEITFPIPWVNNHVVIDTEAFTPFIKCKYLLKFRKIYGHHCLAISKVTLSG